MTRPLIKYKFHISVPDIAGGFYQRWDGKANAWDMQNAMELILGVENASELLIKSGLDPQSMIAGTNPDQSNVMVLHFTEEGRVVNTTISLDEEKKDVVS